MFKFFIPLVYTSIIIITPFANLINFYDKIKNKNFILKAQQKLKNSNVKIIAITGSNGKTSVKNILFEFLKNTYQTLATPHSFNTPLGIAKFINNEFNSTTEYLILEYGARRKNDIKKLCNTFGADYGIITTISPQHLESFKNINNIKNTKNELPIFLKNKMCVYNTDNDIVENLYNQKQGNKISVSLNKNKNIFVSNINIQNGKTNFKLHLNKKTFTLTTNLLGTHNITNILLALSLAIYLKVDTTVLINSIQNLSPTPHRLEHIKTHINILDDSYNCSLDSATQALNVFKKFNGKKMIVTPGIIEGGKQEKKINFQLGNLCSFCDYFVIVGNHNKESLICGFKNIKKIYTVKTLNEAKQYFSLLKPNDSLLLLNDLPDDYN